MTILTDIHLTHQEGLRRSAYACAYPVVLQPQKECKGFNLDGNSPMEAMHPGLCTHGICMHGVSHEWYISCM